MSKPELETLHLSLFSSILLLFLACLTCLELSFWSQTEAAVSGNPTTMASPTAKVMIPGAVSPNVVLSSREVEKQIVDKILGDGYDKRIRPAGTTGLVLQYNASKPTGSDGPTIVKVNTLVRSISKIDDVTMEYYVQLTLRQEWIDDRLAFGKMSQYKNFGLNSITLTEQERIWKPDLFFRNEKEGHFHKIIMPNVLLRINGEGQVLYSIRISLVLACPMDLKYYPLDKQNCTIEMASYGYLDEDLKFIWKEKDPVQIAQPLNLPRFTLETYETAYCTSRTTTGAYSCLRIDLIFKREFSYYLIQIYIPCCMLVIVSWVSFWLDPNAIPARVSLGVTTLLTMATQISGINASLPPVSYTKAIDVWTGVCLTFVFSALLEFALVNYASRSDQHKREMLTSALTHTQKMRWRDANAAAAAAGVAPPTSPPPDDNSPSAMENKHLAFFGGPLGCHHQNNPQMSTSNPQRVVAGSSSMTNPLIPGHHAGSVQYHAQAQDPMLQGSLMTSYSTNGHAAGSTTRMRGPSNSHPIVTVEAGLGASMAAGAACPIAVGPCVPNGDIAGANGSKQGDERRPERRRTRTKSLLSLVGLRQQSTGGMSIRGGGCIGTGCGSAPGNGNPSSSTHSKLSRAGGQASISGNSRSQCPLHYCPPEKRRENFCLNWLRKFPTRSKRIDVISRIFFPLQFALFNLVYWTTYLFREEDAVA